MKYRPQEYKTEFGKIEDIVFPKSEVESLRSRTTIVTHRVLDDARKYVKGDLVYAEQIDSNYCFEVADQETISKVEDSPYFSELTAAQRTYLDKFDEISVLTLKKTKYERPYKLSYIKEHYPERIYLRLVSDECHVWRARTGIDMIHLEPDQAEQNRTNKNWRLLPDKYKRISDAKCKEIFGVTNLENQEIIKNEKDISDDPVFRMVISRYKGMFNFDLSNFRLRSTSTPRYNNGHPAKFPLNQFGGCYTKKGIIYINSDLKPVIKFYGVKVSEQKLKETLIAHELAHHVYQELADDQFKKTILEQAKSENFTTEYLDHVSTNKMTEETFCEYLASKICGNTKSD